MTARGLYLHFIEKLQQVYEKGEAAAITKLVYDYYKIDSKKNNQLATETISLLNNKLDDLLMHKPVQYVLGEAWFYNMYFTVNEHVLIPRPETEELVELAIQCVQCTSSIVHILDIGTGSGCIPVTIKKNVPPAVVYAIDISKDAIAVAKKNAVANNTVVNFLQHDFLNENNWKDLPVFDIIISNPPYIPINEKKVLDKNVTAFEPAVALFVPDENPLLFYEKIARFATTHLKKGGKIFMETHENFAKQVAALFADSNAVAEVKKDISGKERMVVVTTD